MDADLKKLKNLTKYMRENGILRMKTQEIELELSPNFIPPTPKKSKDQAPDPDPAEQREDTIMVDGMEIPVTTAWSMPGLLQDQQEGLI